MDIGGGPRQRGGFPANISILKVDMDVVIIYPFGWRGDGRGGSRKVAEVWNVSPEWYVVSDPVSSL